MSRKHAPTPARTRGFAPDRPAASRPTRGASTAPAPRAAATDEPRTGALLDALRALDRELRLQAGGPSALPPAQARVLQELGRGPARSLGELAARLHTDPSSASVVVQRLVTLGLVARTPADDDRRRTELSLTAAGRAQRRSHVPSADQRLADAVAALGERRADSMTRWLHTLAEALREPAEAETDH
jgi:DNA-binding MarR family transcriptional regulator